MLAKYWWYTVMRGTAFAYRDFEDLKIYQFIQTGNRCSPVCEWLASLPDSRQREAYKQIKARDLDGRR